MSKTKKKEIKKKKLFHENELYFVPLGGSEEFGCNLNVYVCDGTFLAVDCGIGFADERYPGIDLLLPDPKLLEQNKDKLAGLIITHAHEDHIGAVAYLWNRFECPVYASPFTAAVLRRKLEQEGVSGVPIHIIKPHDTHDIGPFSVYFAPVSHSVPDSCALMIGTPYGNILHSGDWNLDPKPVVGLKTEEKTFRDLGAQNILAYIGDSTNAAVDGFSGSEQDVAKGMAAEFKDVKGRIAVTVFASNIGRIISIVKAANDVGRSVCLVGRSLHRMVSAAREVGYLKDAKEFLTEDDLESIPDENIVLIVTGSQGESQAALARIARGDHRNVKLHKGDTVIFSSRAIPGNEREINGVKNNLSSGGVRVVGPRDTSNVIHVSGHPCRAEIEQMLQWVRPQCVIPVHGERLMLNAHAAFAKKCQVPHTVTPNNGSIIRLAPGPVEIVDHVETAMLAVDQRRIIPSTHESIAQRRKLQYSGAVHASLVLDHDLRLLGKLKLDTVGLTCSLNDEGFVEELEEELLTILDELPEDIMLDEEEIAEKIRIGLRRFVNDLLGIKPKTTVHVTLLDV